MTHDELLAKINTRIDYAVEIMQEKTGAYESDDYAWFSLCAVVELHKPVLWKGIEMVCNGCGMDIKQNYNSEYPCPTIQAIEKELM